MRLLFAVCAALVLTTGTASAQYRSRNIIINNNVGAAPVAGSYYGAGASLGILRAPSVGYAVDDGCGVVDPGAAIFRAPVGGYYRSSGILRAPVGGYYGGVGAGVFRAPVGYGVGGVGAARGFSFGFARFR